MIKAEVRLKMFKLIYFNSDSWRFAPPTKAWCYIEELVGEIELLLYNIVKNCLLKTTTLTVCILKQQQFIHRVLQV